MESVDEHEVTVPGRNPPSRSAKRIVIAVAAAAVILVGLAWWVLAAPVRADDASGRSVDCNSSLRWTADAEGRDARASFDRACDDAREGRRNTALLIGAAVATAACAVSTVPSRRLTGEKLGPLR